MTKAFLYKQFENYRRSVIHLLCFLVLRVPAVLSNWVRLLASHGPDGAFLVQPHPDVVVRDSGGALLALPGEARLTSSGERIRVRKDERMAS